MQQRQKSATVSQISKFSQVHAHAYAHAHAHSIQSKGSLWQLNATHVKTPLLTLLKGEGGPSPIILLWFPKKYLWEKLPFYTFPEYRPRIQ